MGQFIGRRHRRRTLRPVYNRHIDDHEERDKAYDNTCFLTHFGTMSIEGTPHSVKSYVAESDRLDKRVAAIIARYTRRDIVWAKDFLKDDQYFDAKGALSLGLIDRVIDGI